MCHKGASCISGVVIVKLHGNQLVREMAVRNWLYQSSLEAPRYGMLYEICKNHSNAGPTPIVLTFIWQMMVEAKKYGGITKGDNNLRCWIFFPNVTFKAKEERLQKGFNLGHHPPPQKIEVVVKAAVWVEFNDFFFSFYAWKWYLVGCLAAYMNARAHARLKVSLAFATEMWICLKPSCWTKIWPV